VVAIGPKGRGFKPGRGVGYLRAIEVLSTSPFGWEVKPEVPCRNILRHVKITWNCEQKFLKGQILASIVHSPYMLPDVGLPDSSGGRVKRFSLSASPSHHDSRCSYITSGRDTNWWPACRMRPAMLFYAARGKMSRMWMICSHRRLLSKWTELTDARCRSELSTYNVLLISPHVVLAKGNDF
jgi:hypothetical protein